MLLHPRSKLATVVLLVLLSLPSTHAAMALSPQPEGTTDPKETIDRLEERLGRLEPAQPHDIERLQSQEELAKHYPSQVAPLEQVIRSGTKIPYQLIREDPDYERPVYLKQWHSSYGRWSFVPMRVHYALHRLFPTYDIGLSHLYQLEGDLGVSFPIFQNEASLDLYLILFQTSVVDVHTKGNQVVVTGKPQRNGVHVLTIKTAALQPSNKDDALLIQLATPAGDELDYSLIPYVPPDFWAKQQKKLQEQRGN